MLPNRTRLRGWNPDSLIVSAASITHAARAVDDAVSDIDSEIRAMPEAQTWSGRSHEAATAMFDRAHRQTTRLSAYAAAVSQAIHTGAEEIGSVRRALLDKADELDGAPSTSMTPGSFLSTSRETVPLRRSQAQRLRNR